MTDQPTITTFTSPADLEEAYRGSYYTITGAGGDLADWVDAYTNLLEAAGIGAPRAWFTTTGAAVNGYADPDHPDDAFPLDLTFLMFPLDGLEVGRLAIFKVRMMDRWFDDIVQNMRRD